MNCEIHLHMYISLIPRLPDFLTFLTFFLLTLFFFDCVKEFSVL